MKAIAVTSHKGSGPSVLAPEILLFPDSSLTVARQPLFLPDFAETWIAHVGIAVRISRLGKTIASRFASRYYDAVTVALRAVPCGVDAGKALYTSFDGALTLGSWIPADEIDWNVPVIEAAFTPAMLSFDSAAVQYHAAEAIEAASAYCTLKSGDVIIPEWASTEAPLEQRTTVTASLAGHECLKLKIR